MGPIFEQIISYPKLQIVIIYVAMDNRNFSLTHLLTMIVNRHRKNILQMKSKMTAVFVRSTQRSKLLRKDKNGLEQRTT